MGINKIGWLNYWGTILRLFINQDKRTKVQMLSREAKKDWN